MVARMAILLICLLPFSLFAEVWITPEVRSQSARAGQPVEVRVKVRHPEEQEVDGHSFRLGDQPVEVTLLNVSKQSSVTIINGRRSQESYLVQLFRFFIEGQSEGGHQLPEISVQVGETRHSSTVTAFEIEEAKESADFRLQAFVEGSSPLYPGQKARFFYQITQRYPMDYTYEYLPLLEPSSGFKLLGSSQIRDQKKEGYLVRELSVEVEALTPGDYLFEEAIVEGYGYEEGFFGRKRYLQPRMRAEAEGVRVQVAPFPERGRPAFFHGALGRFTLSTSLKTASSMRVGDNAVMEVRIGGVGEWSTVELPPFFNEQPFRDHFRFSDLLPLGKQEGEERVFQVELRPLSEAVTEIPSLAFASFDPDEKEYVRSQSDPIPLLVERGAQLPAVEKTSPPLEVPSQEKEEKKEEKKGKELGEITIFGNVAVRASQLTQSPCLPFSLLWIGGGCGGLLGLQIALKKQLRARARQKKRGPQHPLQEAKREQLDSHERLLLLEEAIALWAEHQGAKQKEAAHRLAGELQALRFGGEGGEELSPWVKRVEKLLEEGA